MLPLLGVAVVGLTSLGGQATMVRPPIAPMAEAATEARLNTVLMYALVFRF